jgi:hypothetical protein
LRQNTAAVVSLWDCERHGDYPTGIVITEMLKGRAHSFVGAQVRCFGCFVLESDKYLYPKY